MRVQKGLTITAHTASLLELPFGASERCAASARRGTEWDGAIAVIEMEGRRECETDVNVGVGCVSWPVGHGVASRHLCGGRPCDRTGIVH